MKDLLGISYMMGLAGAVAAYLAVSTDDFYVFSGQAHDLNLPMIILSVILMAGAGVMRWVYEKTVNR